MTTQTPSYTQTYVARQPVLDRARRVIGYELLFRPTEQTGATGEDPSRATARVIVDALFNIGLDTLAGDMLAFINIDRAMLVDGLLDVLPAERVVLEIAADVHPDAEVLTACQDLKRAGFGLSLDDWTRNDARLPMLPLASYVKANISALTPDVLDSFEHTRDGRARLVATRIETPEDLDRAMAAGIECFQGFFFGIPTITAGRPVAVQELGRLRLIQQMRAPNITLGDIEALIKPDAALCYRILQAVNSAAFAQRRTVTSLQQALLLLGRDAVRRWTAVWTLASLGEASHAELISMSAIRARCCEVLGEEMGGEELAAEAFLVGLCSMLDTVLGRPMSEVVEMVPLSERSRAALLGEDNGLRTLLDCTVSYERGDWERCLTLAARASLDDQAVPTAYLDAMQWVRELQRL